MAEALRTAGVAQLLDALLAPLRATAEPAGSPQAAGAVPLPAAASGPSAEAAAPGSAEPPAAVLRLASRLRTGNPLQREERLREAFRLGQADGGLVPVAEAGGRVLQDPSPVSAGERQSV